MKVFFKKKKTKLNYSRVGKLKKNLLKLKLSVNSLPLLNRALPYNPLFNPSGKSNVGLFSHKVLTPFKTRFKKPYNLKYPFFSKKSNLHLHLKNLVTLFDKNQLRIYTPKGSKSYITWLDKVSTTLSGGFDNYITYFSSIIRFSYSWKSWKNNTLRRRANLHSYINLYSVFSLPILLGLYKKVNKLLYKPFIPIFNLYWTFTLSQKFFISLRNVIDKNYNYLSLYSGLFLKFFQNKKPLRRSKLFKTLMVKLLRKILLVSSIRNVNLVISRSSPIFLELYRLLLTPTIIPYRVPKGKGFYNDSLLNKGSSLFLVRKIIFLRTHSFTKLKTRRKGRIKRKITRRLFRKNNVLD